MSPTCRAIHGWPYELVFRFDFLTTDATEPIGELALGRVAADGFELLVYSTKNGTLSWVIVRAGAPAPLFLDVRSGLAALGERPVACGSFVVTGVSANLTGNASRSLAIGVASGSETVSTLARETAYDIYAVVSDTRPDPRTINFNTTVLAVLGAGPGAYCSSRHRMPFNLKNEGSKCVSMTWRAWARQMLLATS